MHVKNGQSVLETLDRVDGIVNLLYWPLPLPGKTVAVTNGEEHRQLLRFARFPCLADNFGADTRRVAHRDSKRASGVERESSAIIDNRVAAQVAQVLAGTLVDAVILDAAHDLVK